MNFFFLLLLSSPFFIAAMDSPRTRDGTPGGPGPGPAGPSPQKNHLERTLTLLRSPSSSNPTGALWKELVTWIEGGTEPIARYSALVQEFDTRAQNNLSGLIRTIVVILHDEKFKAEASANQARKDLALKLSLNAELLERLLDASVYAGLEAMGSRGMRRFQDDSHMKMVGLITVLTVVESLFLITEKLPDSEPLLRDIMPLVDEILGLERFAKLELEKKVKEGLEKMTAAYKTAFSAYKVPFYKRNLFRYGLAMSGLFAISLAVALWILLRRPNMQSLKPKEN